MTERPDFSQFHPLDHYLWECDGYPGGWRRHVAHHWINWHYHTGQTDGLMCSRCGRKKEEETK